MVRTLDVGVSVGCARVALDRTSRGPIIGAMVARFGPQEMELVMNTRTRQIGLAVGFLVVACVGASADTVYVDKTYKTPPPSDGTIAHPYTSIQDAVDALPADGDHVIKIKAREDSDDEILAGPKIGPYEECVVVNGKRITIHTYNIKAGKEKCDEYPVEVKPAKAANGPEGGGDGVAGKAGLLVEGGGVVVLKKVKFRGQDGGDGVGTLRKGGKGGPGIKASGAGTKVDKEKADPEGGKGGNGSEKRGKGGDGGPGEEAEGGDIINLVLSPPAGGDGGAGGDSSDGTGGDGGNGGAGAGNSNGGTNGSSDSSRPQGGAGGRGGKGRSGDGADGDPGQNRQGNDENFYYIADTHFEDDFEGHDLGPICTGGAWEEWEGSEDVCGSVTDEMAYLSFQSLRIDGVTGTQGDDVVQRFGSVGGVWDFSARIFVPGSATGQAFVILLNQYPARNNNNWSLQLAINADELVMFNFNEPDQRTSIIPDLWAELTARIDLDNDIVEVTYEGHAFVTDRSWRDGVAPGGQPWIQAIDLYAGEPGNNGISGIFFDDVSLIEYREVYGACCVDEEGFCADAMLEEECADWHGRFAADSTCADLDPPCGETRGCTRNPQWVCDGDVDGNGVVNPVDVGLVQAAFGSINEDDLCRYDLDCNGVINPVDAGLVQALFGQCDPPRDVCD
jgi:hypothetical protein